MRSNGSIVMTKLSLADYQTQFCQNLLSEEVGEGSHSFLALMETKFGMETADKEARLRLDIYRNNVLHSLRCALGDLYPVVKRLIGCDCFNLIAVDFIRKQPPNNPALLFYGEEFIDYLSEHASVAHLEYLSDVARLEFSHHVAFHCEDIAPLEIAKLAAVDPNKLGELTFESHPSVSLFRSKWAIDAIWHENIKESPATLDISQLGGAYILIYRQGFDIQIVNLDEHCFVFLSQLKVGKTINHAWLYSKQYANSNGVELEDTELSPMLGYLLNLGVFSDCAIQN